jgi:hypothetical protein
MQLPILILFLGKLISISWNYGNWVCYRFYKSLRRGEETKMNCFNCYSEFHPTLSNPICQECGFCYYCRDFFCFYYDEEEEGERHLRNNN